MLNCFNEHFISSGFLFDFVAPIVWKPVNDTIITADKTFSFSSFSVADVHKALKQLNPRKPAGPDHLKPFFLKLAADILAEPLTHIFNLSLVTNKIPKVWKSCFTTFEKR